MTKEKRKMPKGKVMYHVTDAIKWMFIKKSGLKPHKEVPDVPVVSEYSEEDYVYLWEDIKYAKIYQDVLQEKTDMKVFMMGFDVGGLVMEPDFADFMLPSGWKYKGSIPKERIVFDDVE